MKVPMPMVKDVAAEVHAYGQLLRGFSPADITEPGADDPGGDIRLQMFETVWYKVHTGSPDYDQNHRGYWGASWVPAGVARRKSRAIARELIEQVLDDIAVVEEGGRMQ